MGRGETRGFASAVTPYRATKSPSLGSALATESSVTWPSTKRSAADQRHVDYWQFLGCYEGGGAIILNLDFFPERIK